MSTQGKQSTSREPKSPQSYGNKSLAKVHKKAERKNRVIREVARDDRGRFMSTAPSEPGSYTKLAKQMKLPPASMFREGYSYFDKEGGLIGTHHTKVGFSRGGQSYEHQFEGEGPDPEHAYNPRTNKRKARKQMTEGAKDKKALKVLEKHNKQYIKSKFPVSNTMLTSHKEYST